MHSFRAHFSFSTQFDLSDIVVWYILIGVHLCSLVSLSLSLSPTLSYFCSKAPRKKKRSQLDLSQMIISRFSIRTGVCRFDSKNELWTLKTIRLWSISVVQTWPNVFVIEPIYTSESKIRHFKSTLKTASHWFAFLLLFLHTAVEPYVLLRLDIGQFFSESD